MVHAKLTVYSTKETAKLIHTFICKLQTFVFSTILRSSYQELNIVAWFVMFSTTHKLQLDARHEESLLHEILPDTVMQRGQPEPLKWTPRRNS